MHQWQGINEFVAVAQTQSFTTAAKKLNISTAQVSRQISALENRLAVKLFNRTTRKVSLTEVGSLYYQQCHSILTMLAQSELQISQFQATPTGQLRITSAITYGENIIAPLLNDFALQYPQLHIELYLSNELVDLIDGNYDLAIRLGKLENSSLIAKRLGSRRQYVCASPSYIARYGKPTTLDALRQHNCLRGQHDYWRFQEQGKTRNIQITGNLRYNSGRSLADAACKGLGIIQVPNLYVSKFIEQQKLVPLLVDFQEEDEGIWALYPQNRHLLPKVRLFLDYLVAHL